MPSKAANKFVAKLYDIPDGDEHIAKLFDDCTHLLIEAVRRYREMLRKKEHALAEERCASNDTLFVEHDWEAIHQACYDTQTHMLNVVRNFEQQEATEESGNAAGGKGRVMALEMKYFVLKPKGEDTHAKVARAAMRTYANLICFADGKLAESLLNWVGLTESAYQDKEPADAAE